MEVVGGNTLLPGDPRLIDHIVCELKSQGIFDQFRKECIADVDTKPAYQNLRQRVEGSVTGFLKTQNWRPDMNKNQLREMLRKNIYESGFLETGVERIVDQVVNPKINTVFLPQVEEVVYKFLGLAKPTRNTAYNPPNGPLSIDTADLLPTDLDPISPDTELLAKDEKPNETEETAADNLDDSKNDEFESPPFEPINEQTVYGGHDESSNDSRISGISGLTSHDSNMSDAAAPEKTVPDVNNADSQLSKVSSNSRLSIVTTDSKHTPEKMDISDENTEDAAIKIEENTSLIGDKEEIRDELEEIRMEINGHMASKEAAAIMEKEIKMEIVEETTEVKINEQVEDITQKAEEINIKEETTTIKEEISTINIKEETPIVKEETPIVKEETPVVKEEAPVVKEEIKEETVVDSSKTETKKSDKHRHDSEKRKDKHSDKDRKDDKKSDKDKKDKDKYKSSSSSRDKDRHRDKSKDSKSSKDKDGKSRDKSRDDKNKDDKTKDDKSKSSSSSTSKHSSRDRNRSSSSKSESKSSKDSKSKDSKSSSKKSDSSKSRSRDHSKSDSSKHNSSHSSKDRKSSSSSKDYRDKKDPKKSSKDDHSSSRDKKNDTRRSADRDSNDGSSNLNNTNTTSTTSSKEKDSSNSSNKSKSDNSDFSGSNSGDSGQSDNIQQTVTTTLDELALNPPSPQIMKMKKPKIASNIFEVRKLMRIRKKMEKMEKKRQRQQELAAENKMRDSPQSIEDTDSVDSESLSQNTATSIDELVKNIASITGEELSDHETNTNSTAIVSKESWDAIEAKLSQSAHENVDFNLYGEDTGDSSSNTSKDDASTKRAKRLSEEEDCLYFNSEVSPTTERFLQSIERFKIDSVLETKRLKNNFRPSEDDSKPKGKKRKIDGEIDTENNNKKISGNSYTTNNDVLDTLTASPSGSNLSNGSIDVPVKPKSSRVKKTKKNTTVNCSPSSDADSEHLTETKRPSRASILKNQRYSSDDLYKPRPVVSGTSRRQRGLLNNTG